MIVKNEIFPRKKKCEFTRYGCERGKKDLKYFRSKKNIGTKKNGLTFYPGLSKTQDFLGPRTSEKSGSLDKPAFMALE